MRAGVLSALFGRWDGTGPDEGEQEAAGEARKREA